MAPKLVSLDDPTSLQSFVNSMRSRSHPSASSTQVVSDIQPAPNEELEQGEVMSPRSPSQPIDSEHLHEPSVPSPISEEQRIDPVPVSPPRQGLMPPQDTPQTAPASPLRVPAITSSPEQEPTSVGDAIYDYVQGIKGVPLTDSIWAPKHLSHRQSLLRGPRKTKKIYPQSMMQILAFRHLLECLPWLLTQDLSPGWDMPSLKLRLFNQVVSQHFQSVRAEAILCLVWPDT